MNAFSAVKDASTRDKASISLKPAIRAIKEQVRLSEYAATLTKLRRSGATLRGRCPACGGSPHSDALCIYQPDAPAQEQYFVCYRCGEKGDVLKLYMAVEGGVLWEAVVGLSIKFGVQLPERSDGWREWQDDKGKAREAAKRYVARVYQRRLTRLYAPLVLVGGETPEEELELLEGLASILWTRCLVLAERRVSDE